MNKEKILNNLNIPSFYQSHVPSLKLNGKPEALGLCPFHDDHNASLSVNIESGLYRCFSCDAKGDVFGFYQELKGVDFPTALREIGEMTGMANTDIRPKVVAKFEYKNVNGQALYTKERIEPGRNGRSKEFVFKHQEKGKWVFNRGCDPVLYNLPQVVKSKACIIVEGEKKSDLLSSWGLPATCLDNGASSPIKDEYIQILSKMEKVAILPDNDTPGKQYAVKLANALHGKVKELKVVELPGLREAEDIIDWAKVAGNNKEGLIELIKGTPAWIPQKEAEISTTSLDLTKALRIGSQLQGLDIPVIWLVKGLIPQQAITLLSAKGGMGKTILSISIADAVSKGIPFLGLETTKVPVVYVDFENSLPTLVERVKRVDASQVMFWHPSNEIKPPRLDEKEYVQFKELPPGALLVFDTLRASQSRDENDSQHMAMVMQRLKELRDLGFTILILHHTNKYDDKVYKGSTVIYDLCDHNLSFFKVKRGCQASEESTSDDDEDFCYRLGTMHKTRFEPFHMFLEFDIEKGCFAIAPDPETEILEEIYSLLSGKELKQSEVYDLVKESLGIKSKERVVKLLKRGSSFGYFEDKKYPGGKAVFYTTKPIVRLSEPIGLDNRTIAKNSKAIVQTIVNSNHPASQASIVLSDCPDTLQTIRTIAQKQETYCPGNTDNCLTVLDNSKGEKIPVQEQEKIAADNNLKDDVKTQNLNSTDEEIITLNEFEIVENV